VEVFEVIRQRYCKKLKAKVEGVSKGIRKETALVYSELQSKHLSVGTRGEASM
jgi:hypothetical protein